MSPRCSLNPEHLPAVDVDDLPGHPACVVGQQEQAHADEVIRRTHAFDRELLHDRLDHVADRGRVASVSIGPGAMALIRMFMPAEFVRELLRQAVDAGLGEAVEAGVHPGGCRGLVDDRAAAALRITRNTAGCTSNAPSMLTLMNLR